MRECLRQAGAIVDCSSWSNYEISAEDENAERQAYAIATNAWKDQERGFQGMTREEVIAAVKAELAGALTICPSCG